MRVSVLCNDLSSGAALTAMAAADALSGQHDVTIVGPQFERELWPALGSTQHRVIAVRAERSPGFFLKIPALIRRLDGDVVVCCKVRFPSMAVAILNRVARRTPIVLFVDDDELALTAPGRHLPLRQRLADPGGALYTRLADRLCRFAQATVSTASSMQERYGGLMLPMSRRLEEFDPARFERASIRSRLGLEAGDFVVGFVGVPRAHKGFDDLLAAIDAAAIPSLRLLVAPPAGFSDAELRRAVAAHAPRVLLIEDRPSAEVPVFLAACDAVVIPQRSTPEAEGQLPAKLVEAMAMGKAIVATAVSDMTRHLQDCGIIVAPSAPDQLAAALERLYEDEPLRLELGRRARGRYERRLNSDVLGPVFRRVVETAAAARR